MHRLVSALDPRFPVVVVTGAGISVASGIPTFRGPDPDAIWSNDVTEKGTRRFFQRDPAGSWQWYLARFDAARTATPNPAHTALVELEDRLPLTVITQNIDGLHATAGSRNLVEVHGSAHKVRCSRRGCEHAEPHGTLPFDEALFTAFRQHPSAETVPSCELCGAPLRPHVLWFDERYDDHVDYGLDRIVEILRTGPRTLLFIGTSFSVGITDMLLGAGHQLGADQFVIDPHLREAPTGTTLLRERAEVLLPLLVETLESP